jgi:RHS repeat-associated protein
VQNYGGGQLPFEPNVGQTDPSVRYFSHGPGFNLFLTDSAAVFRVPRPSQSPSAPVTFDVFNMAFVGANPHPQVVAQNGLSSRSNYFTSSDPAQWHTDVPQYGEVDYQGLYPGVNLSLHGAAGRQMEYDFQVAPGASPSAIRLGWQGLQSVLLDARGDLVLGTASNTMTVQAPAAYQVVNGTRRPVVVHNALLGPSQVGFLLGPYDHSLPLVIDPVLPYSTYLGGSGDDQAYGVALDSAGNAYVAGGTESLNFPTTPGAYQVGGSVHGVAFVTKLDRAGQVVYSTYLGLPGDADINCYAKGIAVDAAGEAVTAGHLLSSPPNSNFPLAGAPFQGVPKGPENGFVAKLSAGGDRLVASTLLTGSDTQEANAVALDGAGDAYVTGWTNSPDFPITTGAYQITGGSLQTAFVIELSPSLSSAVYSTFLGGMGLDTSVGYGVAVDGGGSAYVTGQADQSFPTTPGAFQGAGGSSSTGFVTKLNASGSGLVYSTFLGGSGTDQGNAIAVYRRRSDGGTVACVTGSTTSTNFPTQSAYQATPGGGTDGFVTALSPAGSGLVYSTYLGGGGADQGNGIATDAQGDAWVTGYTASNNFPTSSNANQSAPAAPGNEAFTTELTAAGGLAYSSYLGGSGDDQGKAVASDPAGNAVVAGLTNSTNFPTVSPYQGTNAGGYDAFVARLRGNPPAIPVGSCDCTDPAGSLVHDAPPALGNVPSGGAGGALRYSDGVVTLAGDDLSSAGFGVPWGQTRSWTNGAGYADRSSDGNGWVDTQLPYLLQAGAGSLVAVTSGTTARYYDPAQGGGYQARFFDQSTLSYNAAAGQYVLTDSAGDQLRFYDFAATRPAWQQGQLQSFADPGGNVTSVTATTAQGRTAEVQRTTTSGGTTVTESYLYTYVASGVNAGQVASAVLRRQVNGGAWGTVRQALYSYYDGTQAGGNLGDLKSVAVQDGSGDTLDTSYYRYYTPNDPNPNGYPGGLKYAFGPDSYARLAAAVGGDPSNASDATVAPYADDYFEYDGSLRVTKAVVQGAGCSVCAGGLGSYTYAYTASANPAGYNSWATKTVETLPDGNQNVVYTNAYGEPMLRVYHDAASGLNWSTFDKYDGQGRAVLEASPSAVTGYDDTKADLLNSVGGNYQYLSDNAGLVTVTDYYAATTAGETTAGGVAGYEQDVKVQQGELGTPVLQHAWQYFLHAANGQTVSPVATDTAYRNTDGTGAETTSYAYGWFSGTTQVQSMTVTKPVISAAQNGPGVADAETTYYDTYGREVWHKDGDGFLSYTAYDAATGVVVKSIADVDTTRTGDFTGLPSGWSTPAGGGLHLVTQYQVDTLGRTTKETSPAGNVTYTVYIDTNYEVLTYRGWNSTTNMPTGPTVVSRQDRPGSYSETLTMTAAPHLTNGVPDGTEAVSGLQTLSRQYSNAAGQVVADDAYFNLTGLTYSTAPHLGTLNTNYYETAYAYDSRGRQNRMQAPTGTITRTVYDGLGRVVSTWVGTNDTPGSGYWSPTNNTAPANMVDTADYVYDNNTLGGSTQVGDGDLSQVIRHPSGTAAARVTQDWYDWRDRQVASKSGVQASESDGTHRPITYTTYDNLDEATQVQRYDADGVTITVSAGVPQAPSASLLRAQTVTSYDDQGRVYRTQVYDANPSTGAVSSSALTTNYYFDHRGDLIATSTPGGLWSKSAYDGVGRDVMDYTTDGAGGTNWAAAGSVVSDTVLEQEQAVYDADGNVIETIHRQRFHNASGTGPLGSPTSGVGARVYYAASYYDAADRLTANVDVGTDGGTAWTRPAMPPVPSDTVLVMSYVYNGAGWVQDVTDPKGIDTRTLYDNLGRVTKAIQDYTGAAEGAENDVTTEYTYDGDGHTLTEQADEPGGAYQRTAYVYGVTTAGGSGVNSNDILTAVQHPDPTTGNPSLSQQDSYTVNALGEMLTATDRNGTTHTYSYDVLGRLTSDAVTTLGAGVDGSVRRIGYAYDTQGNQYRVTSCDAASGGNVVNQVEDVFNGLDQLTGEYQSHSGAVVIGSTPEVQYAYTEMAGGANNSRLTGMTYPSGYALSYNYNSGLESSISRLSSISDSGGVLEGYLYLGLGTVVERDHPQSGVNLTHIKQGSDPNANMDGGDQYTGLDRFGRVIDQNWYNTNTSTSTDRFQYGYDRDGDVLWRNNLVNAAFGELYAYDSLNQLTSFQRGTLNGTDTGLVGSATRSQSWAPDALGNFTSVTTNGSAQTRTANQQNEYTSISGAGAVTYDGNGNTTADGSGNTYVYDAWDRLVQVKSGSTVLAAYGYDGLGRRVMETHGTTTTDLYYSDKWQVLEEPQGGQVQARNVWNPAGVDVLVRRDQSSQHNGVLDQRLYVQQDADDNVTALVGTTGSVLERYAYDPYGAVTVMSPVWSVLGTSAYGAIYLWQGKPLDTGLYDSRRRVVSPTLMRPMQADPLGLGPDSNDYRWEGNDPTNKTDPSGMVVSLYKTSVFGTNRYHIRIVVWDPFSNKMVFYDGRGPRKRVLPFALCGGFVPIDGGEGVREPAGRTTEPLHYNAVYTGIAAFIGGKKYQLPYIGEDYSPFLTAEWNPAIRSTHFKEELDALDKVFSELSQLPVYSVTGPTSNTYARQLLTLAGYKTTDYEESLFPGWDYRGLFRYGGTYFDKYGKPTPAWKRRARLTPSVCS